MEPITRQKYKHPSDPRGLPCRNQNIRETWVHRRSAITLWSYRRSTESRRSWPTPLSQIPDRSSPIVQRVKILLNETSTPCFMVFMSEYNSKHTENDTFDPQHRFADSR